MDIVIAWIIAIMVSVSPVGRAQYAKEAKESREETTERYESIAKDLAEVVYDPAEKPLFSGPNGRAKTALVLLAISNYESGGYRRDVDFNKGKLARGDGGKSWCMMQILLGTPNSEGKTRRRVIVTPGGGYEWTTDPTKGWGGEDLIEDRKKCFRTGLSMARVSFNACGGSQASLKDRLKLYASGNCSTEGENASRIRMGLAKHWMDTKMSSEFKDEDVIKWSETAKVTAALDFFSSVLAD